MADRRSGDERRSRQALQEPPDTLTALPHAAPGERKWWYREHQLRITTGGGSRIAITGDPQPRESIFGGQVTPMEATDLAPSTGGSAFEISTGSPAGPTAETGISSGSTSGISTGSSTGRGLGLGEVVVTENSDGGCWYFASVPDDPIAGGRFDLAKPEGTCYFADTEQAAALERVGRLTAMRKPVPRDLVEGRVVTAVPTVALPWTQVGDLLSPKAAAAYGVTNELFTVDDYPLCQRWAAQARRDGFDALLYRPRFSPDAQALAVFGPAGPSERPALLHRMLRAVLAEMGVLIAPIPTLSETMVVQPDI